jgi:ribosomal protein L23
MTFNLIETEKAYSLNDKRVAVISVTKTTDKVNKVMLKQLLAKAGVNVTQIKVVNTPAKTKRRGKNFHYVQVTRPKKFYLHLEDKQEFGEAELTTLNQLVAS